MAINLISGFVSSVTSWNTSWIAPTITTVAIGAIALGGYWSHQPPRPLPTRHIDESDILESGLSHDRLAEEVLTQYSYSEEEKGRLVQAIKPFLGKFEDHETQKKIIKKLLQIPGSVDEKIALYEACYQLFPKEPSYLPILIKFVKRMHGTFLDKQTVLQAAIASNPSSSIERAIWVGLTVTSNEPVEVKTQFIREIADLAHEIRDDQGMEEFRFAYEKNLAYMSLSDQLNWIVTIKDLSSMAATKSQRHELMLRLMLKLPEKIDNYIVEVSSLEPTAKNIYFDELIDDLRGYRLVNREELQKNPQLYIEKVVAKPNLSIRFENEPGIDGGGLWREFVTIAFQSLIGNSLAKDRTTGFAFPDPRVDDNQKFQTLGRFIKIVAAKGAPIGPFFKSEFYSALALISQDELNLGYPSNETVITLIKLWSGPSSKIPLELLQKGAWDAEDQMMADAIIGTDNATPQDVMELIRLVPIKQIFTIALELDSSRIDLQPNLEGVFDRLHIATACLYEGSDPAIVQQVNWLKEWISECDENGHTFVQFATGSPTLPPQFPKIAVIGHEDNRIAVKARTCFAQVSFPSITYPTRDDFILALTSSIQDPGFSTE